ncbi:T9SS type A sorting domain-containing protein [Flavobacterium filum]|uniref:T9SS type A sorting domain-containing protein n=1 Tax=Flavobacterium filum TaxID=370974 RepID=UPI0023F06E88|nr:T9SS type A sorting domain-containing protein [Flavobacterium filum]
MKKTQITRTTLLAILFFIASVTQAQSFIDSLVLEKVFDRTPYIFEGTVLEKCYFKEPSNGLIYTANVVEVSKFIKGTLQCGTVTVITEGGETTDEKQTLSHNTEFTKGYIGIFACIPSHLPTSTNCPTTDNRDALSLIYNEHAQIDYFADGINKVAEGFNSKFETLQDLYNFLSYKLGYTIIDCNTANFQFFENEVAKIQPPIIPFNEEDNSGIDMTSRAAGDYVKYTLANPQITGHSTKFYEFDVKIEANDNNTFLGKGAFRIGYNTSAFGTLIVSNVILNLDASFDAVTYNNVQKYNINDSTFSVIVDGPANPTNRKNITTTKATIVHIKIPYTNCSKYPNISFAFTPPATATANNIYTLSANAPSSQTFNYDSVFTSGIQQGFICEPEISFVYKNGNFPDAEVSGGTNTQVIIEGNHFLAQRGKLYLKNADDGAATFLPLDHYDILDWNDTLIFFTMPSQVDSAIFQSGSYKIATVGSGVPFVKNILGLKSDSISLAPNKLNIPFSTSQSSKKVAGTFFKDNRVLLSNHNDSAFSFVLNNNISQPMHECVKAAINRWRCATGVNFKLDETTTTTDTVKLDGKNVITLGNFAPKDSGVWAITRTYADVSCNGLDEPFPIQEIDIKVNAAAVSKFFYDTTGFQNNPPFKTDFFAVILHELGHAHQIEHVNNASDLMYFTQVQAGAIALPSGSRRTIKYNDQSGGDYVMGRSTTTNYGFACSYNIPMAMQDTFCRVNPNGIRETETTFEAKVYPNPFTNELYIKSDEPITSIQLFDLQGRLVIREVDVNYLDVTIPTTNLSGGVYILQLHSKHKELKRKVICNQ